MIQLKSSTPSTLRLVFGGVIISALTVSISLALIRPVNATLVGFDPGNIMDDAVMANKSAMTEAQIQNFLTTKNPCNDSSLSRLSGYNATQGWLHSTLNGRPFTYYYNLQNGKFLCLSNDNFNGKSAARIIWQAAQDYSINPQVLIVLLQKEQALITDTWPNNVQYRTATGFGCPDTAPCDSQYYGLENQVRRAAALFREVLDGGWTNYPVGTNYIRFNPSISCGGTDVYIHNKATSALYRYTPYQPNQAALAAGWGSAHCGAYGNRNFYNYFTDWFGSTTKGAVKITDIDPSTDSGGDIARIGISLSVQPSANVRVPVVLSTTTFGQITGVSYVTITPGTWNSPENNIITIKGKAATSLEGSTTYTLQTLQPESSDSKYNGITASTMPSTTILHQREAPDASRSVYRLYNPVTTQHTLTADIARKTSLVSSGWLDEGKKMSFCSAGAITIYYLINDETGDHFMSSNNTSRFRQAIANGYNAIPSFTASTLGGVPVYERYNTTTNDRIYTTAPHEGSPSYIGDRVAFYMCQDDTTPIYRLYKPSLGTHYYTASASDRDYVVRHGGGWRYEGVAFYIPNSGTRPIYRLYKPSLGTHYYTASASDRDYVVRHGGGWRYEGVAFYIPNSGTRPIYRLYKPSLGTHYYTASASDRDYVVRHGGGWRYEGVAFDL